MGGNGGLSRKTRGNGGNGVCAQAKIVVVVHQIIPGKVDGSILEIVDLHPVFVFSRIVDDGRGVGGHQFIDQEVRPLIADKQPVVQRNRDGAELVGGADIVVDHRVLGEGADHGLIPLFDGTHGNEGIIRVRTVFPSQIDHIRKTILVGHGGGDGHWNAGWWRPGCVIYISHDGRDVRRWSIGRAGRAGIGLTRAKQQPAVATVEIASQGDVIRAESIGFHPGFAVDHGAAIAVDQVRRISAAAEFIVDMQRTLVQILVVPDDQEASRWDRGEGRKARGNLRPGGDAVGVVAVRHIHAANVHRIGLGIVELHPIVILAVGIGIRGIAGLDLVDQDLARLADHFRTEEFEFRPGRQESALSGVFRPGEVFQVAKDQINADAPDTVSGRAVIVRAVIEHRVICKSAGVVLPHSQLGVSRVCGCQGKVRAGVLQQNLRRVLDRRKRGHGTGEGGMIEQIVGAGVHQLRDTGDGLSAGRPARSSGHGVVEVGDKTGVGIEEIRIVLDIRATDRLQFCGAGGVPAVGDIFVDHGAHVGEILLFVAGVGEHAAEQEKGVAGGIAQGIHLLHSGDAGDAGSRKASEGHVQIPEQRIETVVGVHEEIEVVKDLDRRVHIHQQVVPGGHPQVLVDVQHLGEVGGVVAHGMGEIEQVGPAVIGLDPVILSVSERIRAQVAPDGDGVEGVGIALEARLAAAVEMLVHEIGIHILHRSVDANLDIVDIDPRVVGARGGHVLARNLVGERLPDKGGIGEAIGQFDRAIGPDGLILDHMVQFDVEGILVAVGVVGTVALVADAHAVVGHSIDDRGSDQPLLVAGGVQGVQDLVPVGLREIKMNVVDGFDVVKILRGQQAPRGQQDQ